MNSRIDGREKVDAKVERRAVTAHSLATAGRLLLIACCLLPLALPGQAAQKKAQAVRKNPVYVCVMDPEVRSAKPGKCPKCGMLLRKATDDTASSAAGDSSRAADNSGDSIKPAQIPDTIVYDQDGKKLRFYSDLVKGKTVAINFIFTTCTTICPPLTATFRKVQQELGAGHDVQLISISVDPTTDVPERLKAFSAKFNAGPGWSFVTGNKQEVDLLLKSLGAGVGDKTDHTPMVLVGNESAGYWTRTYGLAPVSTLVKVITDARTRTATKATAQVPMPGAAGAKSNERQVERHVAVETAASGESQPTAEANKAKTPAESAASYFPNTVLLTQDNKPVRFFDDLLKGKIVLINFMFTTCTGVCPAMTGNMLKVQEYLGERVGAGVNMISISVDPAVDTPDALKKYSQNYKVKPGWYFLTGKKEDVDLVLRKVGGFVKDKNDHTSLLIVGNVETGQWMKIFAMARPSEIADVVIKLAQSK
ncbi:MAG TPA: SCO family protein [Blastocatellia bacterium]|jgi:cytochrome oxidase Cu insertion factor (SCO1/SenC/PrrC family)